MMKFDKFLTYVAMVPHILETVAVVEKFVPIPDAGKKKLDLVLGFVAEAAKNITDLPLEELNEKVTAIVTDAVEFFNSNGVFRKAGE